MNCFQQIKFIEQVMDDADLIGVGKLAAAALVRFVSKDTGACFPGISELGAKMHRKDDAVRCGLKALEKHGHIKIERRFNTSNVYILQLKARPTVAPPPSEIRVPPPENPASSPRKNPDLTGRKNLEPVPVPGRKVIDDVAHKVTAREVERLCNQWQQLASKPGWEKKKAVPVVLAAIDRAGFGAVSHLYAQLRDEGKREAWWLRNQLNELRPVSVNKSPLPKPCSAGADAFKLDTLPVEAVAKLSDARRIADEAKRNPPLRVRAFAAIEAIGLTPAMLYEQDIIAHQLARALAQGHTV